uniref:Uncharacterized protein n=1 Tax=Arundo donax TaxID=35708 RepID=A0A0A8ZY51_ARUDO
MWALASTVLAVLLPRRGAE